MKHLNIKYSPNQQRGVVLIVGLVMMLLLTIIGLAAVRGSGMQELMAGNVRDRNLAFQAAEAGLRMAESQAAFCTVFNGTNGCFEDLNTTAPVQLWVDNNWNTQARTAAIALDVAQSPRYVIERIQQAAPVAGSSGGCIELDPTNCSAASPTTQTFFRVTSLGYGGTVESQVMLQTTIRINVN